MKYENFAQYSHEVFRRLYEEGKDDEVVVVSRPDDICCGPKRGLARDWCNKHSPHKCIDGFLDLEDRKLIEKLRLGERMVPVHEFVEKIRNSNLESISP